MRVARLGPWIIWLTAGGFYLYEFIHRVIIGVMIPELMAAFNVSYTAIGNLSACYFYAYAIAQIPVGLILDRYNTRVVLSTACLTLTLASYLFAITNNFLIAQLCRILIGLGSAFAFVGCLKLASVWFKTRHFGFIIGLTNLLGIAGAIIGGKPAAEAIDLYGWRSVMLASTAVGVVLTIMLWNIIRDANTVKSRQTHKYSKLSAKFLYVVENPQIWLVAIFGGLMVAPIVAYSELWGVSFLTKHYHLDRPTAAQISTLTFIGIAIGGPTIGWLSDRLRKRKLPMLLGTIGALCTMSVILLYPALPIWLIATLHFVFGFSTSSMLLCYSLTTESTPKPMRATTIALVNCVIMTMGASLQRYAGFLLEYTKADFMLSFAPIIACYLLAFICYMHMREEH